jgi:hypothetical protein
MKPWNRLSDDEKNDLLRDWFVRAHEAEIDQYYEDSNGLGDWSAGQEGSFDYFWELINSKKLLVEYPKDFQNYLRKKRDLENGR